jgi:hAT family C-terminal dimerisation region
MESASGSASSTDDELLSCMVKDRAERPSGDNELDSYLDNISAGISAGSTLQFWEHNKSKYPGMFKLHLQHHCVPATSAAVERCFSAAGYIASARQNRLSDSMLENMLVARCNRDLLKN